MEYTYLACYICFWFIFKDRIVYIWIDSMCYLSSVWFQVKKYCVEYEIRNISQKKVHFSSFNSRVIIFYPKASIWSIKLNIVDWIWNILIWQAICVCDSYSMTDIVYIWIDSMCYPSSVWFQVKKCRVEYEIGNISQKDHFSSFKSRVIIFYPKASIWSKPDTKLLKNFKSYTTQEKHVKITKKAISSNQPWHAPHTSITNERSPSSQPNCALDFLSLSLSLRV
jgi:hypothetical protein